MADPVNIISLYSGSGMLDYAVGAELDRRGIRSHVLGYCEREAFAAWFLLDRMEAQALEPAPVFCGDLAGMDAHPLAGFVDLLCASPPCQPYSSAGKRRGNADERSWAGGDGPLPHTLRIIAECRPAVVFFENVGEWFTDGHFRQFGAELCRMGYDLAPPVFVTAEAVGAPHERERAFCLGWLADAECAWIRPTAAGGTGGAVGGVASGAGAKLGDSECSRWAEARTGSPIDTEKESETRIGELGQSAGGGCDSRGRRDRANGGDAGDELAERPGGALRAGGEPSGRDGFADRRDEPLADASAPCEWRTNRTEPHYPPALNRLGGTTLCMFPPGRTDYAAWAGLFARGLDPADAPCVERQLSVVVDGLAVGTADLLRLGGNGIVPAAAGFAFGVLLDDMARIRGGVR